MDTYRKRPVEVQAWQWKPGNARATGTIVGILSAHGVRFFCPEGYGYSTTLSIETPEGTMTASPGDWVIKGIKGEFYPCKPDIFEATYEPVDTGVTGTEKTVCY